MCSINIYLNVAKAVKELMKKEKRRAEFSRMRRATKDSRRGTQPEVQIQKGVTDIEDMWESIKGDGESPKEWVTVTGREEVESLILPWCAKHFNQSEETPFTDGKWVGALNILEESNKVEAILEGRDIGIGTEHESCQKWIKELKKKPGVTGEVGLDIEYRDFKKFVEKSK